jgi:UDP-N-acetylmuramoyl-tripeptide--D-alanyl-D-alanine ligase
MFLIDDLVKKFSWEISGERMTEISGVSTDTRTLKPGDLFVALEGPNFDGHHFIDQAKAKGAACALVMHGRTETAREITTLSVPDTKLALGMLAKWWREKLNPTVIAITGSNGKTSTKEMLAAILGEKFGSQHVLATFGNLNNDIGVPLTLLRLNHEHQFAVIELGMNHTGEIRTLINFAKPDVAIITNIGTAHIGELGSREAIAEAKTEIFENLPSDGMAFINEDDAYSEFCKKRATSGSIVTFGTSIDAQYRGLLTEFASKRQVDFQSPEGRFSFNLKSDATHFAKNAIAASAIAVHLGVDAQSIQNALENFEGVKGRFKISILANGVRLIDDSYNANPDSMVAALEGLASYDGKKIAVLGDMGELGEFATIAHKSLGSTIRDLKIDILFGMGELTRETIRAFGPTGKHFNNVDELTNSLALEISSGGTVLVKGSRFMKMEKVCEYLIQRRA